MNDYGFVLFFLFLFFFFEKVFVETDISYSKVTLNLIEISINESISVQSAVHIPTNLLADILNMYRNRAKRCIHIW